MLKGDIVIKDFPKLAYKLTQAEKDYIDDLKREAKAEMSPVASRVRSLLPSVLPLSGMNHNGRTQYRRPPVKVYAAPRVRNRRRDYIPIAGFRAGGVKNAVGFEYAELAGIRRHPPRPISKGWNSTTAGGYHSYTVNGQGDYFIARLERIYARPGRFFFHNILKELPRVRSAVRKIVVDRTEKLNKELRNL